VLLKTELKKETWKILPEPLVFLYPGQGAQQVGMGLDLYEHFPEARKRFAQADRFLGYALSKLCFEGPPAELNRDLTSQLAVYVVSCILTDLLSGQQIFPAATSGYSSGFYAAGYAAGCYDFEQGLDIVRRAGEILLAEERKLEGTMGNIFGLSQAKVQAICDQIGRLEIGIFNTPSQMIVSGSRSAVIEALQAAKEQGALDAYLICAAVPYHSSYLEPCSRQLQAELKHKVLHDPELPLFSYLDLAPVGNQRELKEIMAMQLSRPVFWVDLIRKLQPGLMIEVGPGMMLARAIRWINRGAEVICTADRQGFFNAVTRVQSKRIEGDLYGAYAESMSV
jgi:[acyl-carrier-protein] S-malonyltransferase